MLMLILILYILKYLWIDIEASYIITIYIVNLFLLFIGKTLSDLNKTDVDSTINCKKEPKKKSDTGMLFIELYLFFVIQLSALENVFVKTDATYTTRSILEK